MEEVGLWIKYTVENTAANKVKTCVRTKIIEVKQFSSIFKLSMKFFITRAEIKSSMKKTRQKRAFISKKNKLRRLVNRPVNVGLRYTQE